MPRHRAGAIRGTIRGTKRAAGTDPVAARAGDPGERERFDEAYDRHHWLGHNVVSAGGTDGTVVPESIYQAVYGHGSRGLPAGTT